VPVLCSVDGLEAEYRILPRTDGSKKCVISFKNQKTKLNVKQVTSGDGYAQYLIVADHSAKPGTPAQRWEAQAALANETPAKWSSSRLDSGGESIEVTLGEGAQGLFPCSGFVRGDLQGTVRAPAIHLKMMGKDIWAFFVYFDNTGGRSYRIQSEKDTLTLLNGGSVATATIKSVDGDPPKLVVNLSARGTDYKKITITLDRAIGRDSLQDSIQQDIVVLTPEENGLKEVSWSPEKGNGVEMLWIFSSGFISHRGPLKDLLETTGAQVNRSIFADGFGGRQMQDFVIADSPDMSYQIGLSMELGFAKSQIDPVWSGLEFSEVTKGTATTFSSESSATETNKFCTKCGSKIQLSAMFCTHCGQKQF